MWFSSKFIRSNILISNIIIMDKNQFPMFYFIQSYCLRMKKYVQCNLFFRLIKWNLTHELWKINKKIINNFIAPERDKVYYKRIKLLCLIYQWLILWNDMKLYFNPFCVFCNLNCININNDLSQMSNQTVSTFFVMEEILTIISFFT